MNTRQVGICVAALVVTSVGGQLAAPRRALADTVNPDLVTKISNADISKWVSLFDNYFDLVSHSATIAELLYGIYNGGGTDIVSQIQAVVVTELDAERDEDWSTKIQSESTSLQEIAMNPNSDDVVDKLAIIDTGSEDIVSAISERINNPPPDNRPSLQELFRIAPLYNAAVLIHVTALKLENNSQDTINLRLREALQTDFNLVGSAATWCDADNSTPSSLWVGSQLYAAMGDGGYNMLCSKPTTELHLQIFDNPDDLVYQQIFPTCQLARGAWVTCQNVDTDLFCPDTRVWGDYFASENCPSQLANVVAQCQPATYTSTWNTFYNMPVVTIVWQALSDTEAALDTGTQSLSYVNAPGFCSGNLYLNDSD